MVTKKFRKDWRELAIKLLASHDAEFTAERNINGEWHATEGRFACPYGDVRFTIYDDWVHFWLEDFGRHSPNSWYGFGHWKQNLHTYAGQERKCPPVSRFADLLKYHIGRFFRDIGHGFPSESELTQSRQRRAERNAQWARWREEEKAARECVPA